MSGACLGKHLGHIVNNEQQSAVLHASVMPFFIPVQYILEDSLCGALLGFSVQLHIHIFFCYARTCYFV